jgi:hypothetical protein
LISLVQKKKKIKKQPKNTSSLLSNILHECLLYPLPFCVLVNIDNKALTEEFGKKKGREKEAHVSGYCFPSKRRTVISIFITCNLRIHAIDNMTTDYLTGRGETIFIVTLVMLCTSFVAVCLRCYVRWRIVKAFGWDDGIMVLAMVRPAF